MTEQQACTLCGADGHRAFECPMRIEEHPPVLVPWSVLDRAVMWVEDRRRYGDAGTIVDDWMALKSIQRAALAQHSPKCATCNDTGQIVVSGPHYCGEFQPPEYETEPCDMCAQPFPAPELERPEVVAYLNEWRGRDQGGIRVTPALSAMSEEGLQREYGTQASVVRREPLMTVSQHDRIGMQWASLVHRAQADADAAQARVEKLEGALIAAGVHISDHPALLPVVELLRGAQVAQAGQVPDALREAVQYLDANFLNQISSGSILHRKLSEALAAAHAQGDGSHE